MLSTVSTTPLRFLHSNVFSFLVLPAQSLNTQNEIFNLSNHQASNNSPIRRALMTEPDSTGSADYSCEEKSLS